MKSIGVVLSAAVAVVAVLSLVVWVEISRMHDCERLGHGFAYCIIVWGHR